MKRLITIALMLVTAGLNAQVVIDKGDENRRIDADIMAEATYAGSHNGQTLWAAHVKNGWQVIGADHQMETTRTQGVKTGADELLAAAHSEDTVVLLLADRSHKGRTDVLVARFTAVGHSTIDTLATYAYGKKDKCLLWGATSPSGNHMALCAIVEYTETKQYSARMTMLDAGGHTEWQREYALGTMEQLYVTDDGRMATLGTEHDGTTLHLIINYADRAHAVTDDATVVCETPRELRIANVVDGHMIALGTIPGNGFRGAEELCGGTIAFAYDLEKGRTVGFTIRPFSNEDIDILYNKPTKKMQHDLLCEHATPLGYVALPYGAAMVMGRNFEKISLADNGTEEHAFSRVGLHIVASDTGANFVWVRNLRRNDWQKSHPDLLYVGLMAAGDTLCIVKSESRKMPAIYEIGKEAKQLKMGDKNNMVLYRLMADGEVKKDILEAGSKHSVLCLTPQGDIITARGSHTRHVKLSFNIP